MLSCAQVFTTDGSLLLTMSENFVGSAIGSGGGKAFATAVEDPDRDGKAMPPNVCVCGGGGEEVVGVSCAFF